MNPAVLRVGSIWLFDGSHHGIRCASRFRFRSAVESSGSRSGKSRGAGAVLAGFSLLKIAVMLHERGRRAPMLNDWRGSI